MRRCYQDHLRKRLVEDESEMSQLTPQVPTTDSGTSVEITPSTVSPQVPPEPEPPSEPSASPETVSDERLNEQPSESNERSSESNERPSEPRYHDILVAVARCVNILNLELDCIVCKDSLCVCM